MLYFYFVFCTLHYIISKVIIGKKKSTVVQRWQTKWEGIIRYRTEKINVKQEHKTALLERQWSRRGGGAGGLRNRGLVLKIQRPK